MRLLRGDDEAVAAEQRDVRDETETVMRIEKSEVGVDVPQKLFSVRSLESSGH